MKYFRPILIGALLLIGISLYIDFSSPYRVVGTVPQSMETGFSRDQTILIYLDRPLPVGQALRSPFTGVVYRNPGDPADGSAAAGTATILPGRKAIAFVPSPPLKAGKFDTANYNYELNFSYATTGLNVVPHTISFSTVALFDTSGIWVQLASPVADAIHVSLDYHPFLIMNEPLDPATVQASNIIMKDAAGHVMPAAVAFDYSNNALSIIPSTRLQPKTLYEITVGFGLKSMAGQCLLYPYVWQFTTRDAVTPPDLTSLAPYIVRVEPPDSTTDMSTTSPITVYFSQPMDQSTLNQSTVHLLAFGQPSNWPVKLTYFTTGHSLTIQPIINLPGNSTISLVFDAENIRTADHNSTRLQSKVNTSILLHTSPSVVTHAAPPPQTPLETDPKKETYLAAHDQLIRDEVAFMNEHLEDDPVTRQAALEKWRHENAPRFQQLELQSHALWQKASSPTNASPILPHKN